MLTVILIIIAIVLLILGARDIKFGGFHAGWLGAALLAFIIMLGQLRL